MEALMLSDPGPDPEIVKYCENLTLDEIKKFSGKLDKVHKICKEIYDQKYKAIKEEGFPRYYELPRDIKREILSVYPKYSKTHYYLDKESKELMSPLRAKLTCHRDTSFDEVRKYIADGNMVQTYESVPYWQNNNIPYKHRVFIDGYEYIVEYAEPPTFRGYQNSIHISDAIGTYTVKYNSGRRHDYLTKYIIINNRPLCRYLPNAGKNYLLTEIKNAPRFEHDPIETFVRLAVNLHAFGLQDFKSLPESMTVKEMKERNTEMSKRLNEYIERIPDKI